MNPLRYTISINLHNDSFKYVEDNTNRGVWISVSMGVFTKGRAIYNNLITSQAKVNETVEKL